MVKFFWVRKFTFPISGSVFEVENIKRGIVFPSSLDKMEKLRKLQIKFKISSFQKKCLLIKNLCERVRKEELIILKTNFKMKQINF